MAWPPSQYGPELLAIIFDRMSKGETLRAICKDDGMPSDSTVRRWVLEDSSGSPDGIAAQYARARDLGLDAMADQLIETANTTEEGISEKTGPNGREITRADALGHRRLKIDTMKWYLAKLAPKRYGDRLELDGKVGVDVGDAILAARKRAGGAS